MLNFFVVLHNIFVVYLDSLTRKLKEQTFIDIFCNIINVFTVTFDKFIVFLQNKSINLFISFKFWPQTFEQQFTPLLHCYTLMNSNMYLHMFLLQYFV